MLTVTTNGMQEIYPVIQGVSRLVDILLLRLLFLFLLFLLFLLLLLLLQGPSANAPDAPQP